MFSQNMGCPRLKDDASARLKPGGIGLVHRAYSFREPKGKNLTFATHVFLNGRILWKYAQVVGAGIWRKGAPFALRKPFEPMKVVPASADLLAAVRRKRIVEIAEPESEALRMLDYFGAEASVGGEHYTHILLRPHPSKAAVLEEFRHGTQARLGIIDRLGARGLGSAETHAKDFLIRHYSMLGLSPTDVAILKMMRNRGL